jgi:hypothetical protein
MVQNPKQDCSNQNPLKTEEPKAVFLIELVEQQNEKLKVQQYHKSWVLWKSVKLLITKPILFIKIILRDSITVIRLKLLIMIRVIFYL